MGYYSVIMNYHAEDVVGGLGASRYPALTFVQIGYL